MPLANFHAVAGSNPTDPTDHEGFDMGKITEKIRVTNLLDPTRAAEVEAVVDTGATPPMAGLVLPRDVVALLGLEKIEEIRVKYADNHVATKEIYGAVRLELKGRTGILDVLAENEGSQPPIGQIIMERLDLVIEPGTRAVMPNPRSPEMPMIEILMAGGSHGGRAGRRNGRIPRQREGAGESPGRWACLISRVPSEYKGIGSG